MFPTSCNKDKFDYKYRNDAITIGLKFDSAIFTSRPALRAFKQI